MVLSKEAKEAIGKFTPALVATADRTGRPNVSPKGSLRVLDDEHLVFAEIRSPRTLANLRENPQVCVICLDPQQRKGCRVWGRAEIVDSGELFESMKAEFAARKMTVNHVVKIFVQDVEFL